MIGNATTEDAIRDRAVEIIKGIVPTYIPGDRFVEHRNERDGDFLKWCEQNPASANRRFQVRFDGIQGTPEVADYVHEERPVLLTTIIAYAHTARTGRKEALDRDTAISRDRDLLDRAVGLYSRPNFSAPHPDAFWSSGDAARVPGPGGVIDFLIITGTFRFRRAL